MPVGPAELNVFSLPHLKIKEITGELDERLSSVCSNDDGAFQSTLEYLMFKFLELKSHEEIENRYIMKPLLPRLKMMAEISLENDIHGDDRLEELMRRIECVRTKGTWSLSARVEFLVAIREDIQNFIRDLLPHLDEEEEVYQPLLLEHFSRQELQDLRVIVLELHHITPNTDCHLQDDNRQPDSGQVGTTHPPPCSPPCTSVATASTPSAVKTPRSSRAPAFRPDPPGLLDLPEEILTRIFLHLSPKDLTSLMRCGGVLSRAAKYSGLWQHVHPMRWFAGYWEFFRPPPPSSSSSVPHEGRGATARGGSGGEPWDSFDDSVLPTVPAQGRGSGHLDPAGWNSERQDKDEVVLRKERFLSGFMDSMLVEVGEHVLTLSLAGGGEIDSDLVNVMLQYCPRLRTLDLSNTTLTDSAFKGLWRSKGMCQMESLSLAGCVHLTDTAVQRVAQALHTSPSHPHLSVSCCGGGGGGGGRNGVADGNEPLVVDWDGDIESCCEKMKKLQKLKNGQKEKETKKKASFFTQDVVVKKPSLRSLDLSGCHHITDVGLRALVHRGLPELAHLNLSGLYLLTGPALSVLTRDCTHLKPESLSYCDSIADGPHSDTASGCANIDSGLPCCRNATFSRAY